jgi:thiamine biosynthesis lipoprotein
MRQSKTILACILSAAFLALLALGTGRCIHPVNNNQLRVWAREGRPGRYLTAFAALGTDVHMEVAAADAADARRMFVAARSEIQRAEALMSVFREDSEVSRLNREGAAGPVALSESTMAVLRASIEFSELSGGAFDVTYAPLRRLWRNAAAQQTLPTPEDIARCRETVGHRNLLLEDGKARFARPGVEVDLGGIAKGYTIDLAADALVAAGARSGLVDIGGDMRLLGKPQNRDQWRVQLRDPPGVMESLIMQVPACAVTTSGDYERGFRVGEQWFSHIVDPRTGRPVLNVPSVTVVAPDATSADALATALNVLGPEQGLPVVESLDAVECLMMVRSPEGDVTRHMSNGFASLISEAP